MDTDAGQTEADQQEYKLADPTVDAAGRALAHTMTDRQIAEESLILLRAFGDALTVLGNNPMLRALPGMGGLFGGK